jgi:hypothetical protein
MRLGPYELEAAHDFGPRITSLRRDGSPNLFVELKDSVALSYSANAVYRLRGGHRLWAAPEIPAVTYAPDDHPCVVSASREAISISAPPDVAGVMKEIVVTRDGDRLQVTHRLTNTNDGLLELAPWAITQLPLGGEALLPLESQGSDLQADRSLVLWPYSRLDDDRVEADRDHILIRGEAGPALKLGSGPEPGWLEYRLHDWRFRKRAVDTAEGSYPDRGAVCQVYVKDAFVELETVGALARLDPGESLEHGEIWEIVLA